MYVCLRSCWGKYCERLRSSEVRVKTACEVDELRADPRWSKVSAPEPGPFGQAENLGQGGRRPQCSPRSV